MIITVPKPLAKIIQNIAPYKKVFVVGCAACATKCQTGGEEAVASIITELRAAGKEVTGSTVLDTPCDIRIVKRDLSRSEQAKASDVLLVLACGGGIQAIESNVDIPVSPALDPVFVGTVERIGIYHEYCTLCGDCVLEKTGGICPISRCAKGLSNGPCGGAVDGKCEIDLTRDCAWALIFTKLTKQKNMKVFNEYIAPRSHAKPRTVSKTKKL